MSARYSSYEKTPGPSGEAGAAVCIDEVFGSAMRASSGLLLGTTAPVSRQRKYGKTTKTGQAEEALPGAARGAPGLHGPRRCPIGLGVGGAGRVGMGLQAIQQRVEAELEGLEA